MRQHLRPSIEHLVKLCWGSGEVGDEQFDAGVRAGGVDLPDRLGVQPRAAVGQVVARHPGDRGVAQAHVRHRFGDAPGLVAVQRLGPAGGDLAEIAAPRALVATDQEGRLTGFPTFEDVGAGRFLAHRVQIVACYERGQLAVFGPGPDRGLHPGWFAFDRGLRVADLQPQQAAAFGGDSHFTLSIRRR